MLRSQRGKIRICGCGDFFPLCVKQTLDAKENDLYNDLNNGAAARKREGSK